MHAPVMHLAQVNLAWMRYPLDDPRMDEMRDDIDRINALGDRSPGFVWRLQTDGGDATDVRVLDDPRILFNLTIWQSIDTLRRYVYDTEHAAFLRRRREWFLRPLKPPVALWWLPAGVHPTVDDGMRRLERLWRDGPTPAAFPLTALYDPQGAPVPSPSRRASPSGPPLPPEGRRP